MSQIPFRIRLPIDSAVRSGYESRQESSTSDRLAGAEVPVSTSLFREAGFYLIPNRTVDEVGLLIRAENSLTLQRRNADPSFFLFALGGVAGLLNLTTKLPFGPGFETVAIATNLAHQGTFANPLLVLPSGPSAVSPPLYPLLLALFMKVLQAPSFVLLAVALGCVFANAVTAALLPRVSVLFYGKASPGVFAAVLWLMAAQLFPSWDANYTAAALLVFCLYSAANIDSERVLASSVRSGVLAGGIFLLNPMSVLVFVPWIGHLLASRRALLRRSLRHCCIIFGMVALMTFPWALRNYRIFGSFLVRTGLGLNLYVSNNSCSETNLIDDLHSGCAALYQPNFNLNEAQALRDLGELNYDHQRLKTAETWMRAHPQRFSRLTFSRFLAFWFPSRSEHPFQASWMWLTTIFSIPGLALMFLRREPVRYFVPITLFFYPLLYYVIFSDVRFRYPILWLSLLPAGYFLEWLVSRLKARLGFPSKPPITADADSPCVS